MAPEKLEKQVAVIQSDPNLVVIYSAFTYLYADGTTSMAPVFPARSLARPSISHSDPAFDFHC